MTEKFTFTKAVEFKNDAGEVESYAVGGEISE
jgi:hypothetical protein